MICSHVNSAAISANGETVCLRCFMENVANQALVSVRSDALRDMERALTEDAVLRRESACLFPRFLSEILLDMLAATTDSGLATTLTSITNILLREARAMPELSASATAIQHRKLLTMLNQPRQVPGLEYLLLSLSDVLLSIKEEGITSWSTGQPDVVSCILSCFSDARENVRSACISCFKSILADPLLHLHLLPNVKDVVQSCLTTFLQTPAPELQQNVLGLLASLFRDLDGVDSLILWQIPKNVGQKMTSSRDPLRPENCGSSSSTLFGDCLKKALLSASDHVQLAAIHLCMDIVTLNRQGQEFAETAVQHGISDYLLEVARTALRGNGLHTPLLHSTLLCLAAFGDTSDKLGSRMLVGAETIFRALNTAVDGGYLPTYVPAAHILAVMFQNCQPNTSANQATSLVKDLCAGMQRYPTSAGDRGSVNECQEFFIASATAMVEFLKWFPSSSALLALSSEQLKTCVSQVGSVLSLVTQTEALNEELLVQAMKLLTTIQLVIPRVESLPHSPEGVQDAADEVQAVVLNAVDTQLVPFLLRIEGNAEAHRWSFFTGLTCLTHVLQSCSQPWSYRLASKLASAGFLDFLLSAEDEHVTARSCLSVKLGAEFIQLPELEVQKLIDPEVLAHFPANSIAGLLDFISGARVAAGCPSSMRLAQCAAFLILHAVFIHHEEFSPQALKCALCAQIPERAHGHPATDVGSAWEPALLASLWAMVWKDTTGCSTQTAAPWSLFAQEDEMVEEALVELLQQDGVVEVLSEGLWPASLFRWILHQRDLQGLASAVVSRWLSQAGATGRLHNGFQLPSQDPSLTLPVTFCAWPAQSQNCFRGIQLDLDILAVGNVILGILEDAFMHPQAPNVADILLGLASALDPAGNTASTLLALGLPSKFLSSDVNLSVWDRSAFVLDPQLQTALLLHVRNMCTTNKRAFLEFVEALILHTSALDNLEASDMPAFVFSLVQHICVEAEAYRSSGSLAGAGGSDDVMVSALNVCNMLQCVEVIWLLRAHDGQNLDHLALAARGPYSSSTDILASSDALQKLTSAELDRLLGSTGAILLDGDTGNIGITGIGVCSAFFQLLLRVLKGCNVGLAPIPRSVDLALGQGEDVMCWLTAFMGVNQSSPAWTHHDPLKEVVAMLALEFILVTMGPSLTGGRSLSHGPPPCQPSAVIGVLQNAAHSSSPAVRKSAFVGLAALVRSSQEGAIAVASCPWTRCLCESAFALQKPDSQQGLNAMKSTVFGELEVDRTFLRSSLNANGSSVAASLLHAGVEPSWLQAALQPECLSKLLARVQSGTSDTSASLLCELSAQQRLTPGQALQLSLLPEVVHEETHGAVFPLFAKVNGSITVFADWDPLARAMCVLLGLPPAIDFVGV